MNNLNFFKNNFIINTLGLLILSLVAVIINQYSGYRGLFPHDSLSHFETGVRITKGFHPFKDFWIVSGPFIDYSQALIFKILGVSWDAYVFHASLINALVSSLIFLIFRYFQINFLKSLFFSICFAFLAYPSSGTPFVDHHSAFFSLIGLYCLVISIKHETKFSCFLIPIFFSLAFFSKQVPAVYISFFSTAFFIIFVFANKQFDQLRYFFIGLVFSILSFVLIGFLTGIKIESFIQQYLFYPQHIASNRIEEFNISIIGVLGNFKFILISLAFFLFLNIKKMNFKTLFKDKNFYYTSIFFILTIILIFHQILTKNQIFIFFLIPLLLGLSISKINNKYLSLFIILLCLFCTVKYHERFNEKRKFHELVNVDFQKALNAELIDEKLKNLKWITPQYSENTMEEINNINEIKNILIKDNRKKMVLSNYSFLSVILEDEFFSTTRWHTFDGTDYPQLGNKYLESYKKLFLKQLKENQIKIIYTINPVNNNQVYDVLDFSCFDEKKINKLVMSFVLKDCKEIN